MDNTSPLKLWTMRLAFVALAFVVLFFHLLPLDTTPRRWAPPDLLMAFAMAWSLRRPDYAPAFSVALVILVGELLLQRPPGLLAVLVVMGSEYLKSRRSGPGESSFAAEWAMVGLVVVAITLMYRLTLFVFVVDQAPLALSIVQMTATIAAYPIVVFVTEWVMGVQRPQVLDGGGFRS